MSKSKSTASLQDKNLQGSSAHLVSPHPSYQHNPFVWKIAKIEKIMEIIMLDSRPNSAAIQKISNSDCSHSTSALAKKYPPCAL
jgi:hypothetical protein